MEAASDAFLLKLSDAMRPLADATAIQAEVCRLLGTHLQADRTYYSHIEEDKAVARVDRDFVRGESPSLVGSYRFEDFGWIIPLLREGRTVVVDDVDHTDLIPIGDRPAMTAIRIRSHISVPVIKRGALVGSLSVTEPLPREWTEAEIRIVQLTAERLWSAIVRARAETALRQSEERYRLLFDTMGQGYIDAELVRDDSGRPIDYRLLEVNAAFERLTGVPVAQARGRTAREAIPLLEDWWVENCARVVAQGYPERIEHAVASLGRWYEAHIYPRGGDRFNVLYEEITERKVAEQRLRSSEERHGFLLRLNDALRGLANPADIQSASARMLGGQLGVSSVGYCEVEADEDTYVAGGEYGDGRMPSLAGWRSRISDHGPGFGPLMRAGQIVATPDVRQDPKAHPGGSTDAAARSIVSGAGVPLLKAGRLVAFFYLSHPEPREWTDEELAVMRDVAERTWAAVERSRAEDALRLSEEKYRSLFQTMGLGYAECEVVRGPDGAALDYRLVELNPAFERLFGMPPEQARGRLGSEVVPGSQAKWVGKFDAMVQDGRPRRIEHEIAPLGRWLLVYLYPTRGDRFAVLYEDITESRRAQAALQAREAQQAFLVRLNDALRPLVDPSAIQATASRLLCEHLQADRSMYADVEGAGGAEIGTVRGQYVRRGEPFPPRFSYWAFGERELSRQRRGETTVVADVLADPDFGERERAAWASAGMRSLIVAALVKGGRLVAGFGVQTARPREWHHDEVALVRETAERTWDAAERARAEEALREAGRRKDEFLATLAHELRNPLAPLRNGLELLQAAGGASDVAPMALSMMDRQLGHLVRLVDDLLDVARISAGKIGLRRRPLPLAEVIARSVEASRAMLQQHGHELRVETGGANLVVDADLDRLVQVFSNLLANAAKYTDRGGCIQVRARHEGGQAVVEVRDTGIGIPQEELSRVFDLFSQVRSHQGRAQGGLGIGLALTQKLVHLHGGGIEAESGGAGQGSTFRVRLPLAAERLPVPPAPRPAATPDLPRRPRRVLVVDDNVDAAVSLAALLRREGHEVAIGHDGWEALEEVPRFRPDVVILDLGMPGLDGIEAARRLRDMPEGRALRLVALTGWGQTADQQRTREAGFDRHLVKPAEREELLRALGA